MDPEELAALGLAEGNGWKAAPPLSFSLDGGKEGDVRVAFAVTDGVTIDKDGHITDSGAIPTKRIPISAYGHTSWPDKGARLPVGLGETGEVAKEAILDGRFFLDTTDGLDTYRTVKALDELQQWSYGYRIFDAERTGQKSAKGRPVVRLKKLDIFEASPTLVGAGTSTRTLGIKSDEDGPLAGLPFGEDFDRVLVDVKSIVTRSTSLRDLRVKEGRELSEANRQRVLALRDSIGKLAEVVPELEELLARTERPDPELEKAASALFLEYQRTITELDGFALSAG